MSEIPNEQWIVLGVVVTIIGVVVTIIIYLLDRQRKELSYEEISASPLLSHEEEVKGKLQISFEGKPIEKLYLVVLAIINTGNVPIQTSDYERQISFNFGEGVYPLSVEVVEVFPEGIQLSAKIEGDKVILDKGLLNKGDIIKLKILVNGYKRVTVDGRIVGVERIKELTEPMTIRVSRIGLYFCVIGIGIVSAIIIGELFTTSYSTWAQFLGLFQIFIGITVILIVRSSMVKYDYRRSEQGFSGILIHRRKRRKK